LRSGVASSLVASREVRNGEWRGYKGIGVAVAINNPFRGCGQDFAPLPLEAAPLEMRTGEVKNRELEGPSPT
jgi:hypothetical protein